MADITRRIPGDDCEGEDGERGERGKRGHRGERGEHGERGHTGPTGPTGPTGATGPTGSFDLKDGSWVMKWSGTITANPELPTIWALADDAAGAHPVPLN